MVAVARASFRVARAYERNLTHISGMQASEEKEG